MQGWLQTGIASNERRKRANDRISCSFASSTERASSPNIGSTLLGFNFSKRMQRSNWHSGKSTVYWADGLVRYVLVDVFFPLSVSTWRLMGTRRKAGGMLHRGKKPGTLPHNAVSQGATPLARSPQPLVQSMGLDFILPSFKANIQTRKNMQYLRREYLKQMRFLGIANAPRNRTNSKN